MKRTIFIVTLLTLALAISIHFEYLFWNSVSDLKELIEMYSNKGNAYSEVIEGFKSSLKSNTNYGILTLTESISIFVSIIFIIIKDFPVFKPLLDKINARRAKRAQAKAEKAEQDKQEKIKALEAQLKELKKD